MPKAILNLQITDNDADFDKIEMLTQSLIRQLAELDIEEITRPRDENPVLGAKGDPFTVGAITLSITIAGLPSLITFIQGWLTERRRVSIEVPNGIKLEFVGDKKYSQDEILELVEKLNQVHLSAPSVDDKARKQLRYR